MNKILLIAGASVAALSVPAEATILTYNVAGTFTDGSILSGSFSFDDAGTGTFSQYSNVSLRVTGVVSALVTSIGNVRSQSGGGSNLPYAIGGTSVSGTAIRVGFFGNYTADPILRAITTGTLTTGTDFFSTLYINGSTTVGLASGTITRATAVVPEPASWAMMLVGFAGAGYAMRRRKVAVSIA